MNISSENIDSLIELINTKNAIRKYNNTEDNDIRQKYIADINTSQYFITDFGIQQRYISIHVK